MPETDYKPPRHAYLQQTHRPLNSLLFVLPLLLFFHVGLWLNDAGQMVELLAMKHLSRLLQFFLGTTTPYLPAVAVVAVLLAQHVARKASWQFRPGVLLGMAGESVVWMLPLLALVLLVSKMDLMAMPLAASEAGGTVMQRWFLHS